MAPHGHAQASESAIPMARCRWQVTSLTYVPLLMIVSVHARREDVVTGRTASETSGRTRPAERPERRRSAPGIGPGVWIISILRQAGPGRTRLDVTSFDARTETITILAEPDMERASSELPHGSRPLAVHIDLKAGAVACTCVVTSPRGPRRVIVSSPVALGLLSRGVHGIVSGRSRAASKIDGAPDPTSSTTQGAQAHSGR